MMEEKGNSAADEVKPNWDKFEILVAIAEEERIKLEKEGKERKLRQNLATFLKLLDEQETEKSIKNGNGVVKLQLPLDQYSVRTKGKRSLRKKRNYCTDLLSKKLPQIPQFDFEGRHQEKEGNAHILFSYGDIIKKSVKRLRCNEETTDQEEKMSRQKKAKRTNRRPVGPSSVLPTTTAAATIPERFKKRILELGGSEESLVFVFEKELTKTDVNMNEHRLLIPFKKVKDGFLTDEEKDCFRVPNKKFEIDAILIDPSLDDGRINLRQWEMRKDYRHVSYNYALVTHWVKVVQKNQLRNGMTVQLWAFRRTSELGFALVLV